MSVPAAGVHEREEDELLLCWEGAFRIELEGRPAVQLRPGRNFVVPGRTRHRPVAPRPAVTLLLETPQTLQYGNLAR